MTKLHLLDPTRFAPLSSRIETDKKQKFTDEQVAKILTELASEKIVEGKAVYICGGKMHSVGSDGKLVAVEHSAASACLWPVAHDVRPAAQSLGIGGCDDCHEMGKPFFFGKVAVDSPMVSANGFVEMIKFEKVNAGYTKMFASSLLAYRCTAILTVAACVVAAAVVAIYAFAGLIRVLKMVTRKD